MTDLEALAAHDAAPEPRGVRAVIEAVCPLRNPRLSEVDWAAVDEALALPVAELRQSRAALGEVVRTWEAYREATAGRGHEPSAHDDDFRSLYGPSASAQDGCSACAGAEYGSEADLAEAVETLARAALADEGPA